MAAGGLLYGVVCLLACDFHFPTPLEQLLWRIAALSFTVLPVLFLILLELDEHFIQSDNDSLWWSERLEWLYILPRLFLIFESFRALAYLPPNAFKPIPWLEAFPHFG